MSCMCISGSIRSHVSPAVDKVGARSPHISLESQASSACESDDGEVREHLRSLWLVADQGVSHRRTDAPAPRRGHRKRGRALMLADTTLHNGRSGLGRGCGVLGSVDGAET